jgi:hypothetical protein
MKVSKAAFDAALGKLLRTDPLPLAEIPKKRKPKAKAKKPTR